MPAGWAPTGAASDSSLPARRRGARRPAGATLRTSPGRPRQRRLAAALRGAAATAGLAALAPLVVAPAAAQTDWLSLRETLEVQRPALRQAVEPWLRDAAATAFPADKPGLAFGKYLEAAWRVTEARRRFPEVHAALAGFRGKLDPGNGVQRQALGVLLGDYLQVRYGADLERELARLVGMRTCNNILDTNAANPDIRKCLDGLVELAQGLGLQAVNHEYAALEITLPASGAARGAAPLAVYTHADVPRVAEHKWETPPFELKEVDGVLRGLGVYDDKGPLIVNLFALRVLRDAGLALQRPVVLVVDSGAEELGSSAEAALARLATRPALALAADGDFPYTTAEPGRLVARITSVRGMKSKAALEEGQFYVHRIQVMENTNTLPAQVRSWVLYKSPPVDNPALEMSNRFRAAIEAFQPQHPETRYEIVIQGDTLHFFTYGRPAHTQRHEQGVHGLLNTAGALLTLDLMPNSARDLLLWVDRGYRRDPSGASLGLVPEGSEAAGTWVNPMRLERLSDEITVLVDIRWAPGRDAAWMQQRLAASIAAFNAEHGTDLKLDWEPGGYEPVQVSLPRDIRRALEEAYGLASGESEPPPAVTTSSTRLLPAAIPFGPAWPGREPRGHTQHEALPRRELQDLGVAYVSALAWLAAGPLPAMP